MSFVVESFPDKTKVDTIGDVHGCFEELIDLITKLGYIKGSDGFYRHPEGRHLAFVGDLVDRGPQSLECLSFALDHHEKGLATFVRGNHDDKLGRALMGNQVTTSHGLGKTLLEFEKFTEEEKLEFSKRILALPHYATFDSGKLGVVHAAPPQRDFTPKNNRSRCLYGLTTGRVNEQGYPERINWVPKYNEKDLDNKPFIVYGHVTHKKAYISDWAACIDTACTFGNALTAFSWPEHKITSVNSYQDNPEFPLLLHDQKKVGSVTSEPEVLDITTFNLEELLNYFQSHEEEVLEAVDLDPMLKKRESEDGLVIANASKGLFEPQKVHQLFAKGLVYTRDPYRMVSMPLVKMHNHGRKSLSDQTTALMLNDPDITVQFPDKLDGTMIQVFSHGGKSYLSTRSVLEGTEVEGESDVDYTGEARTILERDFPEALKVSNLQGYTFIYELIHPKTHVVTRYGGEETMVLLAIYDHLAKAYLDRNGLEKKATDLNLNVAPYHDMLETPEDFERKVEDLVGKLEASDNLAEGMIITFEKNGKILHRVKAKTESYLKMHRLRFQCNYKNVVLMVWNDPELQTEDAFISKLKREGLADEEVLEEYKDFFTEYKTWKFEIDKRDSQSSLFLKGFDASYEGELHDKAYYKSLALSTKEKASDLMPLVMKKARNGGRMDKLEQMRTYPAFEGFKGVIDQVRNSS